MSTQAQPTATAQARGVRGSGELWAVSALNRTGMSGETLVLGGECFLPVELGSSGERLGLASSPRFDGRA